MPDDALFPEAQAELDLYRQGRIKPFQMRHPQARAAARRIAKSAAASPPPGSNAAMLQSGRDAEDRLAQGIGLSATPSTLGAAEAATGNASPTSGQLWRQGGFADPRGASQYQSWQDGTLRPDQIANPRVRGIALDAMRNDPQMARDWEARYRQGLQTPTDPAALEEANRQIAEGYGTGVPHPAPTESEVAANIKRHVDKMNAARAQSATVRAARSIARSDPSKWQEKIDRFNAGRAAKPLPDGSPDPNGVHLTMEDVAIAGRRAFGVEAGQQRGPTYGNPSPDIVAADSYGRQMQRNARAGTIRTAEGPYRQQRIGSSPMAVPVVQTPYGDVPDPHRMQAEEFDSAYTRTDMGAVRSAIMATGFGEWGKQQRAIESARSALATESFSPEQRQQGEAMLDRREAELHRQYLLSQGPGGGYGQSPGIQDMTDPMDVARGEASKARATSLYFDLIDRRMPRPAAREYVKSVTGYDVGEGLLPAEPRESGRGDKAFDPGRFYGTYAKYAADKAKVANDTLAAEEAKYAQDPKAYSKDEYNAVVSGLKSQLAAANDEAWRDAQSSVNPPTPEEASAAQRAMEKDIADYGAAIAEGSVKQADAYTLARLVVTRNVAAFYNQARNPFTNEDLLVSIEQLIHQAANEHPQAAEPPKPGTRDMLNAKFGPAKGGGR